MDTKTHERVNVTLFKEKEKKKESLYIGKLKRFTIEGGPSFSLKCR
jgi:hypothetical protein